MVARSSRVQALINNAKAKKNKPKKNVTLYVEKDRPGSVGAKHLRSFRALDRFRKPR